jgi:hypothetical protein
MSRADEPADAARAMTTVLQKQQRRSGRFGRRLFDADLGMDDLGTPADERDEERLELTGYVVDVDAVATAIIARLIAGRTLQPPSSAPR